MRINSISNYGFSGVWREAPVKQARPQTVAGMELDNIYLQTQTYHPFKDEEIDGSVEATSPVGYNYIEFDSKDEDCGRLYEEFSVAIQQQKYGERLDITKAQYEELLAIQKAGIEATEKLKALGSVDLYKMQLPTYGLNDSTRKSCEIDSETINEILAKVEFVG
ncbi:hypothetical protein IKA92_02835 [bacterium]|nr:hypothetical protein [bacterium]